MGSRNQASKRAITVLLSGKVSGKQVEDARISSTVTCFDNPWAVAGASCQSQPMTEFGWELPRPPVSSALLSAGDREKLKKLQTEAMLKPQPDVPPPPPPPPSPVPAGCKNFLGVSGQLLCTTDAGFSECLAAKKQGKIKLCIRSSAPTAERLFGAGCKNLLGIPSDWLCTFSIGFSMCEKARQKGEVKLCMWAAHPESVLPSLGCVKAAQKAEWSCPTARGIQFCQSAVKKGAATKCIKV
jgi:hypothetical protein